MSIDSRSVAECVALLNTEDASVPSAVGAASESITAFLEDLEPRYRRGGRLIYIGAGTSGRLGVLDASECPPTFQTDPDRIIGIIAGGDSALRTSSESKEDHHDGAHEELNALKLTRDDTLLGVAAGGTTPYVLGALEHARSHGVLTGLLTCSRVDGVHADHILFVDTGPEPITGSTRMKAATATKLVLNTISTTLMIRMGKVYQNLMVDLRATNDKLRDRALRILIELTSLSRDGAAELLDRAEGQLKHAIVMHLATRDLDGATRLLAHHDGVLRDALLEAGTP
jgi:N-acetylmuramic acid 6-phosphate etherase